MPGSGRLHKKNNDDDFEPEPIVGTDILFPPEDCLGQTRLDLDAAGRLGATTSAEYWLLRADLAEAVEEPDTRLKCLTSAIKTEGSSPVAYCRRAEHHLAAGKEPAALRDLNTVIKRFPSFPRPYFLRSRLSCRSLEQQLADLDRYLELNPADWAALFHRGYINATSNWYAEACRDLEECKCVREVYAGHLDYEFKYSIKYANSLDQCGRQNESEIYALEVLDKVAPNGELCRNHWKPASELTAIALHMHLALFSNYFRQQANGAAKKHLKEMSRLMQSHSGVAPEYFGELIPQLEAVLHNRKINRPNEERFPSQSGE